MCSDLSYNALTGSVPSSLSALIKLSQLCVPPFLPPAFARAAEKARMGRLYSERVACREMHIGGVERGRCGSRARCGTLKADLGHAM